MSQHQEHVQDLKADRRDSKEVDGHIRLDMVLQEHAPRLRWRLLAPDHVFTNTGLANLDAELEQFAVNSGSAPHRILRLILRMRSRTSSGTSGRPVRPRRIFHVQNSRKPLRCHAMTVAGFTMTRTDRQPVQTPHSQAHKHRSAGVSFGRFLAERWSTPIWWRSARIST